MSQISEYGAEARRPARDLAPTTGLLGAVDSVLERVVDALFAWQRRLADRAALRALDDRMLRDIGLSRADIEAEISKPFWRD